MKGFFAICIVALSASSTFAVDEAAKKKLLDVYKKCKETNPLTPAEEDMVMKSSGVPDSREAKCLARCIMVDAKALKDGKFNKDIAFAFVEALHGDNPQDAAKAKQIVQECSETIGLDAGNDECDYSYKMIVCNHQKADEMGLKILEWE